jgi:hypothetical protein
MSKRSSMDRASSCAFTFSDGRQCRSLRSPSSTMYCLHHERRPRRLRESDSTALNLAETLSAPFVSDTSLNSSLVRLFAAIADGRVTPKTAAQLISLSKILLKTVPRAKTEFLLAFNNTKAVHRLIRQMYTDPQQPGPISEDDNQLRRPSLASGRSARIRRNGFNLLVIRTCKNSRYNSLGIRTCTTASKQAIYNPCRIHTYRHEFY